jgi:hypothetical protein
MTQTRNDLLAQLHDLRQVILGLRDEERAAEWFYDPERLANIRLRKTQVLTEIQNLRIKLTAD